MRGRNRKRYDLRATPKDIPKWIRIVPHGKRACRELKENTIDVEDVSVAKKY